MKKLLCLIVSGICAFFAFEIPASATSNNIFREDFSGKNSQVLAGEGGYDDGWTGDSANWTISSAWLGTAINMGTTVRHRAIPDGSSNIVHNTSALYTLADKETVTAKMAFKVTNINGFLDLSVYSNTGGSGSYATVKVTNNGTTATFSLEGTGQTPVSVSGGSNTAGWLKLVFGKLPPPPTPNNNSYVKAYWSTLDAPENWNFIGQYPSVSGLTTIGSVVIHNYATTASDNYFYADSIRMFSNTLAEEFEGTDGQTIAAYDSSWTGGGATAWKISSTSLNGAMRYSAARIESATGYAGLKKNLATPCQIADNEVVTAKMAFDMNTGGAPNGYLALCMYAKTGADSSAAWMGVMADTSDNRFKLVGFGQSTIYLNTTPTKGWLRLDCGRNSTKAYYSTMTAPDTWIAIGEYASAGLSYLSSIAVSTNSYGATNKTYRIDSISVEASGENLLSVGSFESGLTGWTYALEGYTGQLATGTVTADTTQKRSGLQSVKIDKTNGKGWIRLRASNPITLQKNMIYTFRGYYHCENASAISSLLILRMNYDSYRTGYESTYDLSYGVDSQSVLLNSASGIWEKRVMTTAWDGNSAHKTVYPIILVYGNPCTVWLDDLQVTAEPYFSASTNLGIAPPFWKSESEVDTLLNDPNRASDSAAVSSDGKLLINGISSNPVWYKATPYDETNHYSDYEGFSRAGINIVTVPINIGGINGHPAAAYWTGGTNGYHFIEGVKTPIMNALRKNPNARLILELFVYPYPTWGDTYPDECWKNSSGQRAYSSAGNIEGYADSLPDNKFWYPSYHSTQWRTDMNTVLSRLVSDLKTVNGGLYWKPIIGWQVTGGQDGQFQTLMKSDFSNPARTAFHTWCQSHFVSIIGTLNTYWGTNYTSWTDPIFLTDPVPTLSGQGESGTIPILNINSKERNYREFVEYDSWILKNYLAGVLKTASNSGSSPKATVASVYGNSMEYWMGYVGSTLSNLSNVDIVAQMSYYPYRNGGYDVDVKPEQTLKLRGKLMMQELDLRSWNQHESTEVKQIWMGGGTNANDWKNKHLKTAGAAIAAGHGFWYYDMNRYFYNSFIMGEITRTKTIADNVYAATSQFRPDVCVVRGGISDYVSLGASMDSSVRGEMFQIMALNASGVPYDVHYLYDILYNANNTWLQDYKIYIFLNTAQIANSWRDEIIDHLRNNGKYVIWLGASGYCGGSAKSITAMSTLTGITLATNEVTFSRKTMDAGGDAPFIGMTELYMSAFDPKNTNYGSAYPNRYQKFWVNDGNATQLATYIEDPDTNINVAAAMKNLGTWTSLFIGQPNGLSSQMLYNIATSIGAYSYGPPGLAYIHMNGKFVSAHAIKSGSYVFTVPAGVTSVGDVTTEEWPGTPVSLNNGQFTMENLAPGETRWYVLSGQ